MFSIFTPPRQVTIGDVAALAGTTPRAIRHHHEIGLLPEPVRGADDRRRYGYADVVRLLWIRRTAEAGIALDDIRDAFADPAPTVTADDDGIAGTLERLEETLVAQEAELRRRRMAVQRMRSEGSRLGLLSDVVTRRLAGLPEGSLRQADLDSLLVTERVLGPLVAALQAVRFVTLALHPELRAESDRVDAAEEALDADVAVDDPCVALVAAERHAVETALEAAVEAGGLAEDDDALVESWVASHPAASGDGGDAAGAGRGTARALAAIASMPLDHSPARRRCAELAEELAARE